MKVTVAPCGCETTVNECATHARAHELRDVLRLIRDFIKEGEVPRYYVISGAGLNVLVEEVIDPLLERVK